MNKTLSSTLAKFGSDKNTYVQNSLKELLNIFWVRISVNKNAIKVKKKVLASCHATCF
jgi:hypothetical protein